MKVKIKKQWYGHVSVRDYVVKKAIDSGEPLTIIHNKQEMFIKNKDIEPLLKNCDRNIHKSKFNNSTYELIDIPWKPTGHDL